MESFETPSVLQLGAMIDPLGAVSNSYHYPRFFLYYMAKERPYKTVSLHVLLLADKYHCTSTKGRFRSTLVQAEVRLGNHPETFPFLVYYPLTDSYKTPLPRSHSSKINSLSSVRN